MEHSDKWLVKEYLTYERQKHKQPIFISDWDSDFDNLILPKNLVHKALKETLKNFHKYAYIDTDTEEKEYIINYLNQYAERKFIYENIAISSNSTNAIYLSILALNRINVKRFLVLTPTYYTVLETLNQLSSSIIYYHLSDKDSFNINLEVLVDILRGQFIEAIIITDPVYSAGIEIPNIVYDKICEICVELNIWFVCDYTLGGMTWHSTKIELMNFSKFNIISKALKFLYIESIPKKMFLNGIKHTTIISSPEIISIIEDITFSITGGLCSTQVNLYKEIYKYENHKLLLNIIKKNIDFANNNFNLLRTSLIGTNFSLYNTNSGYFTILYHKELVTKDLNIKLIVRDFLFQHDIYIYPTSILSYYKYNKFGFRINLMKNIKDYIPLVLKCINKNFDSLYKIT